MYFVNLDKLWMSIPSSLIYAEDIFWVAATFQFFSKGYQNDYDLKQ